MGFPWKVIARQMDWRKPIFLNYVSRRQLGAAHCFFLERGLSPGDSKLSLEDKSTHFMTLALSEK